MIPNCPHCNDSGMLSIWSGLAISQLKDGALQRVRSIAVACSCRRGERYVKACRNWRFDERKMFAFNGDTPEERERLMDFLETRRVARVAAATWNPDNFEYPGE